MKPHLKMILQLLLEASILRMVLGTECSAPLGMESGAIEDSQLTASSFRSTSWGNSYPPEEARLNNDDGAWYPAQYDTDEWLQVDLLVKKQITGIKTQGHQYVWTFGTIDYYVKKFKVLYSDVNNEAHLVTFQESGSDKIFDGNTDADGVKTNNFEPPINARFIRLMATDWRWRIALRLELLGCDLQKCSSPLGMVSRDITDSQLRASSSYNSSWGPNEARLYNNRAWYPGRYNQNEWLQVDLLKRTSITGIQTQGDVLAQFSTHRYVKSFKLSYSDDGEAWNTIQDDGREKIFTGNSDGNEMKTNNIDPPIRSRFIRLKAVAWQSGIAFRLELLGCELQGEQVA
ncbi:PREDICTED: lactadherin-like [Branchiostoma belcheri]|uniref:Lactadherin-like n=1 Tax=Branchiostoma belcheri TaxID=7741 RepID=A0A6P5AYG6_BRABE|nr:PREDICTED: lactadherin-like [Branchiostoma belcheri]